MKTVRQQLQELYLSYVNDFISSLQFAEYYGIEGDIKSFIDTCERAHEAEVNEHRTGSGL